MLPKCLLTGASGGIGKAVAKQLAEKGYSLVLQGRKREKLAQLLSKLPGQHEMVIGDLNSETDRGLILSKAFQSGEPTVLINNAGVSLFSAFNQLESNEISQTIETNLTSTILFTYEFLRRISFQKSTVVNIGSAFGAIGYPGYSIYCASKFGLKGFTEALSREFANSDIRVCYFAPRATDTNINPTNVIEMNKSLGSKTDSPDVVATELLELLEGTGLRRSVGWPEKFFARLNGVFPEIVDRALNKSLPTILKFTEGKNYE